MSKFVSPRSLRVRLAVDGLEDRLAPALIVSEIFNAMPTLLIPTVGPTGATRNGLASLGMAMVPAAPRI